MTTGMGVPFLGGDDGDMETVVAVVPTARANHSMIATLAVIAGQTRRASHIIVGDQSAEGIDPASLLGWMCHKFDIEVVRIDRSRGLAYHRDALTRYARRAVATPGLIWSVDDDVIPFPDTLMQLLRSLRRYNAAAAAARIDEVRPVQFGFGARDYVVNAHSGQKDGFGLALRTACILYRPWTWPQLSRDQLDSIGPLGEDIVFTACMGRMMPLVASGLSYALHARDVAQPYLDSPLDDAWLERVVYPIVGRDYADRMAQRYGAPPVLP